MALDRTGPAGTAGKATTIVDIARAAGVSKSTVSLVLQGSPLVKSETKERVEAAMARVGYVYNRGAANLRTAKSSFVGMIISDLMNPFFAELAVGIEDALYKMDFVPILANTNEDLERQAHVLRSMREHGVAGIVMSPARGTDAWRLATDLPKAVPTVITMRRVIGSPLAYVGPDNRTGARMAVEHLVRLGWQRIAFLGGYETMTTQQERISGWREALVAAGLPADDRLVFEAMPTREGGRQALEQALASDRRPHAFLCYNDIVAMGATRALATRGIRVGQDVAVVGFDDIAEAEHNAPPLTTVNAETRRMGALAAEALLGITRGEDAEPMSFIGGVRLVVRESCGAVHVARRRESA
jgi:LacI family transcriptional regulator